MHFGKSKIADIEIFWTVCSLEKNSGQLLLSIKLCATRGTCYIFECQNKADIKILGTANNLKKNSDQTPLITVLQNLEKNSLLFRIQNRVDREQCLEALYVVEEQITNFMFSQRQFIQEELAAILANQRR